ncbi:hypothetical protein BG004_005360 [Podila humilis]|nr:hypothetical protein BG004_005360 [Podila humilis]
MTGHGQVAHGSPTSSTGPPDDKSPFNHNHNTVALQAAAAAQAQATSSAPSLQDTIDTNNINDHNTDNKIRLPMTMTKTNSSDPSFNLHSTVKTTTTIITHNTNFNQPDNNNAPSSIKSRSPPQALPPGCIALAQAQFQPALVSQLQLNTKVATSSPPTLNLVPATPGPSSSGSNKLPVPVASDMPNSNPSTLSKHKGLPVLPFLVTPKEEKSHGTIWGLWDHDDTTQHGKSTSKVTKAVAKGPPSTSGSAKVVTSMGAEAGRKALLALQSVAADEGGAISSLAPRKKASAQQLTSKFTILSPSVPSSLSVASAPVTPHKDRDMDSIRMGNSQTALYESFSLPVTPTENRSICLPENGFFLAVMSLYWSNLVGPRIEQIWSPRLGCPDESTLDQLSKQILNGEVMRTSDTVEAKMVVLQEEAMSTKFVLSFVVPLVYLQNFSGFFGVMSDHAPVLIEVLRGLRSGLKLNVALDLFAEDHLVPFIEDIMTMEAVAMAVEGAKVSHIALGREGDQVFGREFINRAITSHLQTYCSTVVVGNNITIMNMMINTLALFLSAEDRAKSCHARKQHRYLPDLFLQGIYTPSVGKQGHSSGVAVDGGTGHNTRKLESASRLYHILSSPFPTTIVDTVRCKVEQTERFPKYTTLRCEYRKVQTTSVINRAISRVNAWNASNQTSYLYQGSIPPQSFQKSGSDASGFWGARRENGWTSVEWKGQKVVRPVLNAAPMIENLVRCVVGLPIEMREGYVRQWRRGLVKRALMLVKFVRKEGIELAEQIEQQARISKLAAIDASSPPEDEHQQERISAQEIFQQLGLDSSDLGMVLGVAERLLPSITEFVRVSSILGQANVVSVSMEDSSQIPVPGVLICGDLLDRVDVEKISRGWLYENGTVGPDHKTLVSPSMVRIDDAASLKLRANGDWLLTGKCLTFSPSELYFAKNIDGRNPSWGVMQRYVLQTSPNSRRYRETSEQIGVVEKLKLIFQHQFARLNGTVDNDLDQVPLHTTAQERRRLSNRYSTGISTGVVGTAAAIQRPTTTPTGTGRSNVNSYRHVTEPERCSIESSGQPAFYFSDHGAPGSRSLQPLAPIGAGDEVEEQVEELIRLIDLRIDERMWSLEKTLSRYYLDGFRLRHYEYMQSQESKSAELLPEQLLSVLHTVPRPIVQENLECLTPQIPNSTQLAGPTAASPYPMIGSRSADLQRPQIQFSGTPESPASSSPYYHVQHQHPTPPSCPPRPQLDQQQQQHQLEHQEVSPLPIVGRLSESMRTASDTTISSEQSDATHSTHQSTADLLPPLSQPGFPPRRDMRGSIRRAVERLQQEWPQDSGSQSHSDHHRQQQHPETSRQQQQHAPTTEYAIPQSQRHPPQPPQPESPPRHE